MATDSQTASFGESSVVRVPLRRRNGETLYALIDEADAHLVLPFRWSLNEGYAARMSRAGHTERMARRILGLKRGDGLESEHVSRDKLDNRRSNLRIVTHAQNSQNRLRTDGGCKARGVSRRKDKKTKPYQAYGCLDGNQFHLGFYETEDEAAKVSHAWRMENLPFAID